LKNDVLGVLMAYYAQFTGKDGSNSVLVEVSESDYLDNDADEDTDDDQDNKASLSGTKRKVKKFISKVVGTAQKPLTFALQSAIENNISGLQGAIDSLENKPTEVEMTFGIKTVIGVGKIPAMAICKADGESNYTVKMIWKK
jgi:hypothetical protein